MAHELIYCEDRDDYEGLMVAIKTEWPQAVFEDGSDDIHEYRFSTTIADLEQDDFFRFAIKKKFALSCLGFQLDLRMDTNRIKRLIEEIAPATVNVPE